MRVLWRGMLAVDAVPSAADGLMVALIPKVDTSDPL